MTKLPLFLQMFSQYEPSEPLKSRLSQAAIVAADLNMAARSATVTINAPEYITIAEIEQIQVDICRLYSMRSLHLTATHPAVLIKDIPDTDMIQLFAAYNPIARGSLAGARWEWEEDTLTVHLLANGKKELEGCIPGVRQALKERFGIDPVIHMETSSALEGSALFDAMEKIRVQAVQDMPAPVVQKKEAAPAAPDTIYGKPIKSKPVAMKQINLDMGTVTVSGRVFAVDHKELPKRNAVVIRFDISDNTSSVRVSRFMERKEAEPVVQGVKVGSVLIVSGKLMIDNYTNEMVLKPNAIMQGHMESRKDLAQGEKRVELHLHTAMSNMDALTNTKAAIKQAAAWGHRAIAITDHGCVQSFTDALHVIEDWKGAPKVTGTDENIKVLYGCEAYYINDVDDRLAVHGDADMPLTGEYVAFDLETTGLQPRHDTIIEIGAVRMKDGKELDRFQTFVKCSLTHRILGKYCPNSWILWGTASW